jgi:hypothetical protein
MNSRNLTLTNNRVLLYINALIKNLMYPLRNKASAKIKLTLTPILLTLLQMKFHWYHMHVNSHIPSPSTRNRTSKTGTVKTAQAGTYQRRENKATNMNEPITISIPLQWQ